MLERQAMRVPVLMYHRIGLPASQDDERHCVRPKDFSRQMQQLERDGHRAISLGAFFSWLDSDTAVPDKAFLITFDDGYRGVYQHAYPVLREMHWPFAVFLVSTWLGARDAGRAAPAAELLGRDELTAMADGVHFGSHSRTHRPLPSLSREEVVEELTGSKAELESFLGRSVDYLAYPYGETNEHVADAARRAGYKGAFGTRAGFNRRDIDRFGIRRLDVSGSDTPRQLARKVALGSNNGSMRQMARYFARRMTASLWP